MTGQRILGASTILMGLIPLVNVIVLLRKKADSNEG
jgi:hypothetical protein